MLRCAPLPRLLPALALAAGALALSHCADLLEDGFDIPISFEQAIDFGVDLGAATGATAGLPAPADASYALGLGAIPVDLISSSPELERNRSKIQSIELTKITVTPANNTLTAATPPIDLYIGPKGATGIDQAIKIATLPPIPAGSSAVITTAIDTAAQEAAQPMLTSFDFTVIPVATLSVRAGETIPGGAADLHIVMGIRAVVDLVR